MKTRSIFALAVTIANSTLAQQVVYCSGTVRYPSGAPAPGALVEDYPGHHDGAGPYVDFFFKEKTAYEIIGKKDMTLYWGIIIETNSIMARDVEKNLAAVQEFHMRTTHVDLVLQPAITV